MKNILLIDLDGENLISSVNDGSNRLFINSEEIPSQDWVGEGNYITTVRGHPLTIKKTEDLDGNIIAIKITAYNYELRKARNSGEGTQGATSYTDLTDKPSIEGVTLEGDKTFEELNLQGISNSELEEILKL